MFATALLLMGTAAAQDGTYSQWLSVPITVNSGDKLQLWTDLHARRGEDNTLLIVRPGIGARLGDNVAAHVGYAWIPTFPNDGGLTYEQRAWEQVIVNIPVTETVSLQSRTRFEQRFVDEQDLALRVREFVRLGARVPDSPFQVLIWDELFLGLNEPGWAPQGYDQNRLFGGAGVDIPEVGRLELGYIHNHLNRGEGINNHVLFTQLVVSQ